jgi:uncharacterized membrane protein YfcA
MAAICGAGVAAGGINAVVGSGSLITFPTLLAFGFPPVIANVSNNVGLVPGNLSGSYGYRRELAGQRDRLVRLGAAAVAGALAGAVLLLWLPASAFALIVPALILIACLLVALQPWLAARVAARQPAQSGPGVGAQGPAQAGPAPAWLVAGVFLSAVYGGYFGAAQGVLVIGLLGIFVNEGLQRINGAKNVLVAMVNGAAAVVFIAVAHVNWLVVALIAAGSTVGGVLGSRLGRRLPPLVLRMVVILIGVIAALKLIFF